MTCKDQVKILNDKIESNANQCKADRLNAEISAFPSSDLNKYEFLRRKDLKYKPNALYRVKLEFSLLGKAFRTGLDKTAEGYQEEGVIKLLKDIRDGLRGSNRRDGRNNNDDDNNDDNNGDDNNDNNNGDDNNDNNNEDNNDDNNDNNNDDNNDNNNNDDNNDDDNNNDNNDDDNNDDNNDNNNDDNNDMSDLETEEDAAKRIAGHYDYLDKINKFKNGTENNMDNFDKKFKHKENKIYDKLNRLGNKIEKINNYIKENNDKKVGMENKLNVAKD